MTQYVVGARPQPPVARRRHDEDAVVTQQRSARPQQRDRFGRVLDDVEQADDGRRADADRR